jgi:DNA polymerase-3 subunit epsilon
MKNFIALDFETATAKRNSMCAVGLVVVQDNVIIERFHALIQPPGNEFTDYTIRVHNILPEYTAKAPLFPEIYPKLRSYIHGKNVVCHNSDFDIDVLMKTLNFYEINDGLNFDISCTMKIYGGAGLDVCCQEHGITLAHHDPLSDAEACAYLFMKHSSDFVELPFNKKISQPQKNYPTDGRQHIGGNMLKQDLENVVNKESYFYKRKVVITGTFEQWPDRTVLADKIKKLGADIDSNVTPKTEILIIGKDPGPSKVQKMIFNLNNGKNAIILNESDLLKVFEKI